MNPAIIRVRAVIKRDRKFAQEKAEGTNILCMSWSPPFSNDVRLVATSTVGTSFIGKFFTDCKHKIIGREAIGQRAREIVWPRYINQERFVEVKSSSDTRTT